MSMLEKETFPKNDGIHIMQWYIWLVLIESTCAYTWDKFKVKIVPCDQAFQHIDFYALLFPKESILAFLKRNLIYGFGLKGGNFWMLHQKKMLWFCHLCVTKCVTKWFSSNSAKTIIQSWSSCNKGNKPSQRIWPLSISHGFFNYVTYDPWYMCKFP